MKPLVITALFIAACFPPCFPSPTNTPVPDDVLAVDVTLSLIDVRNSIQFLIDSQSGSKEDKAAAAKDGRKMISILDTFIDAQHK
jgi:hypothetical protein